MSLNKLSDKSSVYMLELAPKSGSWDYRGITQISQLGQYHNLTVKNSSTRLYTVVNCMHQLNRNLMTTISEEMKENLK